MRLSVVIPTYERRDLVVRNVAAFDRQTSRDFEVVVAVDGSTDGTADALRRLAVGFRLVVVEQPNLGGAAARNAGAAAASGDVLLLLDDDMEPDPALVEEHLRSHAAGAEVVLGHIPTHPESPRTLLSEGLFAWARERRDRLTGTDEVPLADLLTGQVSVRRALFDAVGGFDDGFTRGGLFGGEDIDFGTRLVARGAKLTFNPDAITHQTYVVDPAAYLRRTREAGRAAQELMLKHPERAAELGRRLQWKSREGKVLLGGLAAAPAALSAPLRAVATALVRTGRQDPWVVRFFFRVRDIEYHRGARGARRAGRRAPAVLAYHAIADLGDDRRLRDYGVVPERFAAQLDGLRRRGRHFVDLRRLQEALDGGPPLPPGSVLVTFDDAYVDLRDAAAPVLAERGIPAVVFVVGGEIGGTNGWDQAIGARRLDLLDAGGLRAVRAGGIALGAHGLTHRPLARLPADELRDELEGAAAAIEALGAPRPRALSYPHGEWSAEVTAAARTAGYALGFTTTPGHVLPGTDPLAVPRIEVLRDDTPALLRLKLATAAWPERVRDPLWRLAARAA